MIVLRFVVFVLFSLIFTKPGDCTSAEDSKELESTVLKYLKYQANLLTKINEHSDFVIGKVITLIEKHGEVKDSHLKILLLHFVYARCRHERGSWCNTDLNFITIRYLHSQSKGEQLYSSCRKKYADLDYTQTLLRRMESIDFVEGGSAIGKLVLDTLRESFVAFARDFEKRRTNRWKCVLQVLQELRLGFNSKKHDEDSSGPISDRFSSIDEMSTDRYVQNVVNALYRIVSRLVASDMHEEDVSTALTTQNSIPSILQRVLASTSADKAKEWGSIIYKELGGRTLVGFGFMIAPKNARDLAQKFHTCFKTALNKIYLLDQLQLKSQEGVSKVSRNVRILAIAADKSYVSSIVYDCYYSLEQQIPLTHAHFTNKDLLDGARVLMEAYESGRSRWDGTWMIHTNDQFKEEFVAYEKSILESELSITNSF